MMDPEAARKFPMSKETQMEKTFSNTICGGLLLGAIFGLIAAGLVGLALGGMAGAFIGWFIAAAVLEQRKKEGK